MHIDLKRTDSNGSRRLLMTSDSAMGYSIKGKSRLTHVVHDADAFENAETPIILRGWGWPMEWLFNLAGDADRMRYNKYYEPDWLPLDDFDVSEISVSIGPLLLDGVVASIVLMIPLFIAKRTRYMLRCQRGLCGHCGYPLRKSGSNRCSECGWNRLGVVPIQQ